METEIVCTGLLDHAAFTALLASCTFLQDAFLLLEKLPQQKVEPAKRADLLRCARFTASMLDASSSDTYIHFADYTSGRIFASDFELRWEHERDKLQVVYVGPRRELPSLQERATYQLAKMNKTTKTYYLFGERLTPKARGIIGPLHVQGDFAVLRIPRLLHYPVGEEGRYVQLSLQEYCEPSTGNVVLFRFQALEAVG